MITEMAHVCFTVSDLDRSIQFYCERLGLRHAFDFKDEKGRRFGVYIKVGGRTFIELFEGVLGKRADGQSFAHICLEVDDIQATVRMLRQRGIEVGEISMGCDHSYQAWLADPDGNRIELHGYTPESWQGAWLD